MTREYCFASARNALQTRMNNLIHSMGNRNVTVSAMAHSDKVGTILIIVNGIQGSMMTNAVLVKSSSNDVDKNGNLIEYWYGFANGFKYKLAGIEEIQKVIKQQITYLSQRITRV